MSVAGLVEQLSELEDPRMVGKVDYHLTDILVIAVCAVIACAVLAEAESFEDIALYGRDKRLLMPSSDRPARRPWRQYAQDA